MKHGRCDNNERIGHEHFEIRDVGDCHTGHHQQNDNRAVLYYFRPSYCSVRESPTPPTKGTNSSLLFSYHETNRFIESQKNTKNLNQTTKHKTKTQTSLNKHHHVDYSEDHPWRRCRPCTHRAFHGCSAVPSRRKLPTPRHEDRLLPIP